MTEEPAKPTEPVVAPVVEPKEEKEEHVINDIDRANVAAERLETANKEKARLLAIEEKLAVQKALGGDSEAGQQAPKKKEETPEEYATRLSKGETKNEEGKF